MKQQELEEMIKDEVRKIVISHKEGKMSDEEYFQKMTAYSEICEALNS